MCGFSMEYSSSDRKLGKEWVVSKVLCVALHILTFCWRFLLCWPFSFTIHMQATVVVSGVSARW